MCGLIVIIPGNFLSVYLRCVYLLYSSDVEIIFCRQKQCKRTIFVETFVVQSLSWLGLELVLSVALSFSVQLVVFV